MCEAHSDGHLLAGPPQVGSRRLSSSQHHRCPRCPWACRRITPPLPPCPGAQSLSSNFPLHGHQSCWSRAHQLRYDHVTCNFSCKHLTSKKVRDHHTHVRATFQSPTLSRWLSQPPAAPGRRLWPTAGAGPFPHWFCLLHGQQGRVGELRGTQQPSCGQESR